MKGLFAVTFHWIIVLLPTIRGDIDAELIENCCVLGSTWAASTGGRCTPYPRGELSVNFEDTDACLSLIDICCGQTLRAENCNIGMNLARTRDSCSSLRVSGGDTETYTHQKECCQCCQLGKFAASYSQSCQAFATSGRICAESPECCESFYTCCNSTSNGQHTFTTTTATTTFNPETGPVHIPGGMCSLYSASLCEHYCHDAPERPRKFRCSCRKGFEPEANMRRCVQSLEEKTCETHNPCSGNAECYERSSELMCRCPPGYRLTDGNKCEDVDECLQGVDNCGNDRKCENERGGFTCVRVFCGQDEVYDTTAASCVKKRQIQEVQCRSNQIYDHFLKRCVSARPTNQRCPQGYAYNVVSEICEDLDECISELLYECNETSSCINIPGSYLCDCGPGMVTNPNNQLCEDLDECGLSKDNCDRGQRCENTQGSFVCRRAVSCGTGYTLQESSQVCVDINECQLGSHNCGPAFTCQNLPGSFRCQYKQCSRGQRLNVATGECVGAAQCRTGFSWNELTRSCQDVNECLTENPCLSTETCTNTEGSYRCTGSSQLQCSPGYELNHSGTSCVDIDECDRGLHNCETRGHCTNTQGSFRCRCSSGYQLHSVSNQCVDIDECSSPQGQFCSPLTSNCVNTQGSFFCECKDGFESIIDGRACQDVNECLRPNMCDHTCHNVWGGFQCRCRSGFKLAENERSCVDINECQLIETRGRLCSGFCENTPGSFRCDCPPGYRLGANGRECIDIDECGEGLSGCNGVDQVCINTRGSYKCNVVRCPRYFTLASDNLSRNSVRCARQTFVCAQSDVECFTAPLSISYNYLTLRASRLRIPTELFTMRGPDSFKRTEFDLDVWSVTNIHQDAIRIAKDNFQLEVNPSQSNVAVVSIVLPIQGQQDIVLKLDMNLYNDNGFFGSAAAYIHIYATVDPWEDVV